MIRIHIQIPQSLLDQIDHQRQEDAVDTRPASRSAFLRDCVYRKLDPRKSLDISPGLLREFEQVARRQNVTLSRATELAIHDYVVCDARTYNRSAKGGKEYTYKVKDELSEHFYLSAEDGEQQKG